MDYLLMVMLLCPPGAISQDGMTLNPHGCVVVDWDKVASPPEKPEKLPPHPKDEKRPDRTTM